jgi:hypothetical protein
MQLLAPASKARIRDLMSVLFNHAIRWEFTDRNPISGPNKGAGVRQSSKRQSVPDILEVSEIQAIVAELQLRERVLLFLDMATGLFKNPPIHRSNAFDKAEQAGRLGAFRNLPDQSGRRFGKD